MGISGTDDLSEWTHTQLIHYAAQHPLKVLNTIMTVRLYQWGQIYQSEEKTFLINSFVSEIRVNMKNNH